MVCVFGEGSEEFVVNFFFLSVILASSFPVRIRDIGKTNLRFFTVLCDIFL